MSLREELGLTSPIENPAYEVATNIRLTGNLLAKEGDRILRPLGLTDSQFNVLMLLAYQSQNGEMNQTILGNMLLVNRSNVTGLIDRMEHAGWVKRASNTEDRRVNLIKITRKGQTILNKAEKLYFDHLNSVINKLVNKDQKQIVRLLEKFRDELRSSEVRA